MSIPSHLPYARRGFHIAEDNAAEFLRTSARTAPRKLALVFGQRETTYAELDMLVDAAAANLEQLGATQGMRVAVALPNGVDYVVTALGILRAGATIVPLYASAPAAEVLQKCTVSRATLLVADMDRELAADPAVRSLPGLAVIGADALRQSAVRSSVTQPGNASHEGMLPFTSGSTGQPKGILLTHGNLMAGRLQFTDATCTTGASTLVHFLPLAHVYGWMALTAALARTGTVVLHERYDFGAVSNDIARYCATALFGVPQTVLDLLSCQQPVLARLRSLAYVNTGSAALAPDVVREAAARAGVLITTGYGLTEAAPVAHSSVNRPELVDPSTVGFAVAGTDLKLISPATGLAPASGEPGELLVRGPQVCAGYVDASGALDRSSFDEEGFFRTGDLVSFDAAGRLVIEGRLKNIIKYKGYSVVPAELESILFRYPGVADCAVIGRPDPQAGEIPVAFVAPLPGASLSAGQILGFVRTQIAPQKAVREVVLVQSIPRSSAGKVIAEELLRA